MTLLLDTGAVYACYDHDDAWHEPVRTLVEEETGPLTVPAAVISEVDHLLGARIAQGAQVAFYEELAGHVYLVARALFHSLPGILLFVLTVAAAA